MKETRVKRNFSATVLVFVNSKVHIFSYVNIFEISPPCIHFLSTVYSYWDIK